MITNYHQHSRFSDGHGELSDFAEAGVAAGLAAMGFSDHAPLNIHTGWTMEAEVLDDYRSQIRALQAAYRGRIELYMGLELDYIAEDEVIAFQRDRVLSRGWDYVIGSIHYLGREPDGQYWSVDLSREVFERGLDSLYNGDARRYVDHYLSTLRDMARDGRCQVVGHMDYPKRFNDRGRYFSEEAVWYRGLIDETLRAIAAAGTILEVNAGGWRSPCRSAYPSPMVLRRACALGIPVTLSSDAHTTAQLTWGMARLEERARRAGYGQVMRLLGGRWQPVALESIVECGCADAPSPGKTKP